MIRAFYQYLRDHVDLPENFQFQYNRPKTDFYREQQKLCIGPLDQFISSLIVEFESNRLLAYRMGLTTLKFKQSSLWKMFQKFIEISGERFEVPLCSPNLILLLWCGGDIDDAQGKQNTFTKTLLKKKGVRIFKEALATSYLIDVSVLKGEMIASRVFDEDAMWIVE